MTQMDKEYIEKEYEQAIKEYNAALTEDDLDTARRTMKRLEAIPMPVIPLLRIIGLHHVSESPGSIKLSWAFVIIEKKNNSWKTWSSRW